MVAKTGLGAQGSGVSESTNQDLGFEVNIPGGAIMLTMPFGHVCTHRLNVAACFSISSSDLLSTFFSPFGTTGGSGVCAGSRTYFQGSGFRVQDSGFRIQGSGFRVQGSGFRVQGSGFRVQGLGFRV